MRNVSVLQLISFFFCIALIIINSAFFIESARQVKDMEYFTFQRFMLGMRIRGQEDGNITQQLKQIGLKNSEISPELIRQNGEVVLGDSYSDMIRFDKKLYFVPRSFSTDDKFLPRIMIAAGLDPSKEDVTANRPALENLNDLTPHRIWLLWLTVDIVMAVFFIAVLRRLLRLRNLKNMIRKAGEKDKFKRIKILANDEIGQIAGEFNTTINKLNAIKEARTLFLRNILHEFRNPVMKGKMVSKIINDDRYKNTLNKIFVRQEMILGEMVKVEKFISNEWELNQNYYRLIDIIDHARDLLLSQENDERLKIQTKGDSPVIKADFELYATAVKNLIDNALKYSDGKVFIDVSQDALSITSDGDEVEASKLDFDKAFNRKNEGANSGLGLGLYIANQIFKKHGHVLGYERKEGKNNFFVYFIGA